MKHHVNIRNHLTLGPVAQWIRHRPREPGIAGWSPAGVGGSLELSRLHATMTLLRMLVCCGKLTHD